MANFSIPDIPSKTELAKGTVDAVSGKAVTPHTGAVQFAVNNSADEIIDGKLSIQPDGQAKAEWFALDGESQRDFKNSASETVKVNISVPADVAQGEYSFRLLAAAVTDPDNDFAISPSTAFTVPVADKVGGKKKGIPWWVWLLIALVVLGIIGGVVFALTRNPPPPPPPPTEEASTPAPEPTTAAVPDLIGKTVADAKSLSGDFAFQASAANPTGLEPNTVLTQNPAKDTVQTKGIPLVVTFDPGVTIPPLKDQPLASATNAIIAAKLKQGRVTTHCINSGTPNLVFSQDPGPGGPVKMDTTVTLVITALPPSPLIPCRSRVLNEMEMNRAVLSSKAGTFDRARIGQ